MFDMATAAIRVVDARDKGIPGVKVRPYQLIPVESEGSRFFNHKPWHSSGGSPEQAITNVEGWASFRFPKKIDGLRVKSLSLYLSHPDYCTLKAWFTVATPTPVELPQETLVIVRAKAAGGVPFVETAADHTWDPREEVYVKEWSRHADGHSASARLPRGKYVIRSVSRTRDGSIYYGEPRTVNVAGKVLELEFEAHPALTLRGELDSSVPRPVRNGDIFVRVTSRDINRPSALPGRYDPKKLRRVLSAKISEEGTFVLPGLPAGEIEKAAAQCDGFFFGLHSVMEELPRLSVDPSQIWTVRMGPTGSVVVTVLGPERKPAEKATVFFHDDAKVMNVFWLGEHVDSMEWLFRAESNLDWIFRDPAKTKKLAKLPAHMGDTDATGTVTLSGLVAGQGAFTIMHAEFQLPVHHVDKRSGEQREFPAEIFANTSVSVTLKLEKRVPLIRSTGAWRS